VLFSWNGLGAAFGPVILCGLWFPSTNLYGAIAGIAGGFLTTVCWVLWFKGISLGLLEIIPGFIVGLVLTMAVSRLTRHHSSG
jgi:Na+/proline symporter